MSYLIRSRSDAVSKKSNLGELWRARVEFPICCLLHFVCILFHFITLCACMFARRVYSTMAHSTVASPYSRAVVNAMRRLYPEALADKSFDNTGLLLESPFDPLRRNMNSVLLTVDLTKAVADEAIERQDSIIIAYRGFSVLSMWKNDGSVRDRSD